MTPIADMVSEMLAAGLPHDAIVLAVATAERTAAAARPVEIPVDITAEKRRAYDRERKRVHRKSAEIPPESNVALSIEEPKKEKKKESRATRIPPDWRADEEFAKSRGLDSNATSLEAEKFRNYWSAKSGRDATKVDWAATWRNWVLRVCEQRGIGPPTTSPAGSSAWRPGLPTSEELEAKYGKGTGNTLAKPASVDEGGARLRGGEQGMVCGEARQPGARRMGEILRQTGMGAVQFPGAEPGAEGRGDEGMDGSLPMARVVHG